LPVFRYLFSFLGELPDFDVSELGLPEDEVPVSPEPLSLEPFVFESLPLLPSLEAPPPEPLRA
jgi:hypothetical protein